MHQQAAGEYLITIAAVKRIFHPENQKRLSAICPYLIASAIFSDTAARTDACSICMTLTGSSGWARERSERLKR